MMSIDEWGDFWYRQYGVDEEGKVVYEGYTFIFYLEVNSKCYYESVYERMTWGVEFWIHNYE